MSNQVSSKCSHIRFPKIISSINKQSIKSPKLFQPSLRCVGLIVDRVKRSFISLYSKKTMMDFDKISSMDRLFTDYFSHVLTRGAC